MALAKDRISPVQTCAFTGNILGEISLPEPYCNFSDDDQYHHKTSLDYSVRDGSTNNTSTGPVFQYEEADRSLINFKSGSENIMHVASTNGSLLSFEQNESSVSPKTKEDYSVWEVNLSHNYQWSGHPNAKPGGDLRPVDDFNCFDTASNYVSYSTEATTVSDIIQDSGSHNSCFLKRPYLEESTQGSKKQCTSASKKPKPTSVPSKDPQSIAAKNRRERISERLKILQELVPNGSKVDLVTMLEKAISYVKFLQLQVKVLATDEFWPVQGGKAPDISQVKEAIDAILSSQRDRTSSSK